MVGYLSSTSKTLDSISRPSKEEKQQKILVIIVRGRKQRQIAGVPDQGKTWKLLTLFPLPLLTVCTCHLKYLKNFLTKAFVVWTKENNKLSICLSSVCLPIYHLSIYLALGMENFMHGRQILYL